VKINHILFTATFLISFKTFAQDSEKVIYGIDNRVDVYVSSSKLFKTLSTSTAAMIANNDLESAGDKMIINGSTLEGDGICSNARFAKQTTAANCSGFLVGKDLLITAGHCIRTLSDCDIYSWVFDFSNSTSVQDKFSIPKKDIYKCTEIIARALDESTMNDFALLKLDRLTDRTPLKFRKTGKLSSSTKLVVIGHPSGLPTKIADGALVRSNGNNYFFQASLDTFGGNSGSAVFNSKTGLVEGILVRGERDYVLDSVMNCYRPKVCKMNGCRGEDVTRITNIKVL
jgi:hypothetical protein